MVELTLSVKSPLSKHLLPVRVGLAIKSCLLDSQGILRLNDPRHYPIQSASGLPSNPDGRVRAFWPTPGRWLPLLLLLCQLGAAQPAFAQQGELPVGAPDAAPAPLLPTPLGAGAGANAPVTRPKSLPLRGSQAASTDANAPLPGNGNGPASDTTSTSGDDGNATLFGLGGNGKAVVPTVTRRVPYSFSLSVSGAYDDNTSLSRKGSGGDFYFSISPSFVFGLDNLVSAEGNYLHFTYSPSISIYLSDGENDSVQHLISLDTQYRFGQFSVGARVSVQILDGTDTAALNPGPGALLQPGQTAGSQPVYATGTINQANLDVSGRSELNLYDTSVNVSYAYSERTSFSGGLGCSISDYSSLLSSENLTGDLYVNYIYSLKTTISAGLTGGHTFVEDPSPDQNFIQANLQASYRYSSKFSLAGSVGAEFLLSNGQSGVDVTPVFTLSATYQPYDSTSLALSASRSIQSSAVLAAQDFESTGLTLSVQHVINSRLSGGITLGYGNSQYISVADNVSANRNDNYVTIQPTLSISLRPGLALSLFYLHRENFSSGQNSRSFSNNQAGFSIGYAF